MQNDQIYAMLKKCMIWCFIKLMSRKEYDKRNAKVAKTLQLMEKNDKYIL